MAFYCPSPHCLRTKVQRVQAHAWFGFSTQNTAHHLFIQTFTYVFTSSFTLSWQETLVHHMSHIEDQSFWTVGGKPGWPEGNPHENVQTLHRSPSAFSTMSENADMNNENGGRSLSHFVHWLKTFLCVIYVPFVFESRQLVVRRATNSPRHAARVIN